MVNHGFTTVGHSKYLCHGRDGRNRGCCYWGCGWCYRGTLDKSRLARTTCVGMPRGTCARNSVSSLSSPPLRNLSGISSTQCSDKFILRWKPQVRVVSCKFQRPPPHTLLPHPQIFSLIHRGCDACSCGTQRTRCIERQLRGCLRSRRRKLAHQAELKTHSSTKGSARNHLESLPSQTSCLVPF